MRKAVETVTVKISEETKQKLGQIAKEKEWTISHVCRNLIEKSLEQEKLEQ